MKKIIPMILVIFLVTGCVQPQPETHQVEVGLFTPFYLFPETLNGQVKEIYERSYLAHEEDGQLVKGERLTVAARDSVAWTNDFHLLYDDSGNLLQADLMDENDALIDRNKQTFQEGKLLKSEYFKADTLRAVSKFTFDENGILTNIERFRMPVDTLIFKANIISDENGNTLEWRLFNPKDEPTNKYIFTVDENGKRTGFTYYNLEGEKTLEQQYTYNDMGFMSKQVIITRDGTQYVSEYEYEYDDMGNWISTKSHSTESPSMITERTITYYGE